MAKMLSLTDVLPRNERVDVGNEQILIVFGISGEDIGAILLRFPNAFQQIANAGSQPTAMEPTLLGAMFAASQRKKNGEGFTSLLGDEATEMAGRSLAVADQVKVMAAIGRCTFPEGVGPFLESLVSMSSATVEAMEVVVKVASRGQPTESPPTPKPSEPPATPPSGN